MARRSSARLRERSTTPKRVSLSHDAAAPISTTRTPKTLPAKLSSLLESDEMPGAFPQSASPSLMDHHHHTPTHRTPIQPSAHEMHPQLHHQSTAKPLDEARHLGFSNILPQTEPAAHRHHQQDSPTRNCAKNVTSPSYEFTFRREHSLELSPEAKKLMYEKREEAARIKKQMIADGEGEAGRSMEEVLLMSGRKKAIPGGRYSSVHDKQFAKMGSIANHPSAFRTHPNRGKTVLAATKSLKRSPSKAELDVIDHTPSTTRPSSRDTSKPTPTFNRTALPRTTSMQDLTSPAKRVKRAADEDVSTTRPLVSKDGEKSLPSTPQTHKKQQVSYPDLSHLTTPTQSSLSRAASIKSIQTSKIPGPQFTPAKAVPQPTPAKVAPPTSIHKQHDRHQDNNTPLLHRSPSKPSVFSSRPNVDNSKMEKTNGEKHKSMMDPQLARTPAKAGMLKRLVGREEHAASPREKPAPLLSRSPVKAPIPKVNDTDSLQQQQKTAPLPFLARSPSKIPMTDPNNPSNTATSSSMETPGKSTATKLLGRFNLLRQSPMKSILRSPQRLYSDDPSKIAAGTHMATPPKKGSSSIHKNEVASVRKRVDFSSSTKSSDSKSTSTSDTPIKSAGKIERTVSMLPTIDYPSIPREERMLSPSPQKRRETAGPGDFTFRADEHGIVFQSPNAAAAASSTSRTKRKDTIRFVHNEAPVMISATPTGMVMGSKKRKHDFEDRSVGVVVGSSGEEMGGSDKENSEVMVVEEEEEVERPAKRMKASSASPVKTATRGTAEVEKKSGVVMEKKRSTLGVKPKGAKTLPPPPSSSVKKTAGHGGGGGGRLKKAGMTTTATTGGGGGGGLTTISQARLNALSQPKRR